MKRNFITELKIRDPEYMSDSSTKGKYLPTHSQHREIKQPLLALNKIGETRVDTHENYETPHQLIKLAARWIDRDSIRICGFFTR